MSPRSKAPGIPDGEDVSGQSSTLSRVVRSSSAKLTGFALLVFCALQLASPHFVVFDDNATYHLPNYVHTARSVAHGELPHLNRFQYLATPHLASGQTGVFYPPVYLAVALAFAAGDFQWAIDLLFFAHWLISGLALMYLLRGLELGESSSLSTAFLWLLFPFVWIVGRSWIVAVYAFGYSALSLHLLLRLLRRGGRREALALAGVKTLFFFTGHPQFFLLSALFECVFCVLWIACRPDVARRWRDWLAPLAAAVGLTAAWAAPLLLSLRHLQVDSARRGGFVSKGRFLDHSLEPLDLLQALVFRFRPGLIFEAGSGIFFLCPLVLVLVLVGIRSRSARVWLPWAATSSLALIACTSKGWGLLYGVPVLSYFTWPFKTYLFFGLYLMPLAAFGIQSLRQRSPRWTTGLVAASIAIQLGVVVSPDLGRTLSTAQIDRELTQGSHPLEGWMTEDGRVATLVRAGGRIPSLEDRRALLAYQLPTLVRRPHLAGYEPLVGKRQHDLSLGAMFGIAVAFPEARFEEMAEDFGVWGVRYLLTPVDGELRRLLIASGRFEYLATAAGGNLFRNLEYRPVVENLVPGRPSPDARWHVNGVVIDSEGPPALFRVAVAEIDGWTWSLDGEDQGAPALSTLGGFQLPVPPGRHVVELRYRTPGFDTGLLIAAAATLLLLLAILLRRRLG